MINSVIGRRYGKWTVLARTDHKIGHGYYYLCRCDCGTEKEIPLQNLSSGKTKSCGCGRSPNLIGQRFTRLVVMGHFSHGQHKGCVCKCDCGNVVEVDSRHLLDGSTKSCGCYCLEQIKKANTKHGMRKLNNTVPEYRVWTGMRNRCFDSASPLYKNYGGRGISVCERWNDFSAFYSDMGPRPSPGYSIDRIDVNGNYEPSNCRWATAKQQANNRRNNIRYNIDGVMLTIPEISQRCGVNESTLRGRLYRGIDINNAIKPIKL